MTKKKVGVLLSVLAVIIIVALLATILVFMLKPKAPESDGSFEITIMFMDKELNVLYSKNVAVNGGFLEAALTKLDDSCDKISLNVGDRAFGVFVNSFTVDGTSYGTAEGEWVVFYTDDEENYNTEWGSVTLDGKYYASAVEGISSLPVKEGKTYIFTVI